ncbi:MAG TPA: hypothetical protein VEA40_08860, partial [Ramlibacter sp.]|nr:hypothetical protein [Ramlibacter sp.]
IVAASHLSRPTDARGDGAADAETERARADHYADVLALLDRIDARERVAAMLHAASEGERAVALLRLDGYSLAEAGEMLGYDRAASTPRGFWYRFAQRAKSM